MNKKLVYQVGNNKKLYYDARPTKYQDQLWKPFLQHVGASCGIYTPYTSGCHGNHGVRACTSQKTHNPITVVTMAIRAWLIESLTQGY